MFFLFLGPIVNYFIATFDTRSFQGGHILGNFEHFCLRAFDHWYILKTLARNSFGGHDFLNCLLPRTFGKRLIRFCNFNFDYLFWSCQNLIPCTYRLKIT